MSEKRKRDRDDSSTNPGDDKKRQKRGFTVGPQNLPDGTYRRKNQQIKQHLIDKAKIKKEYARLKKQGKISEQEETIPTPASAAIDETQAEERGTTAHPDRQNLIDYADEQPETTEEGASRRKRKPKAVPFRKEYEEARKRKADAEERRRAREEAELERQKRTEERERFRRAMAKARTGGPNGQRKLGRESKVLLEKVKRLVGS